MAGLSTVTTPVTGTPVSSTTFGVPVANDISVLANPPIAKMTNSTTQSFTNNTSTAVTFDTETYDTVGGHSTTTNTSRYTAQTGYAGYYRCTGTVWFAGNATGKRVVWFRVNGADVAGVGTGFVTVPNAGALGITTTATLFLNAADYVEMFAFQGSGGALATIIDTTFDQTTFEVQWVHQ